MFEDNPLEPSPFVFDSHDFSTLAELDSFFNFNSSSSSSRQTSPAIPAIAEPQPDLNDLWFDFSNVQDDINSPKPVPSKSNADSPWDFFTFPHDSPGSGTTSTSGGLSPSFAIDPQLMVTPATSKAASDFGDDDSAKDEHGPEEEDDEDDEGPVTPPPARPGNKTKDRKHVVHSGGVQKKVHISAVVKTDPFDNTLDDWRPTPDEYQKMSSKEKRQLRNKISARNFRNRRKGELTFSSPSNFDLPEQNTSPPLSVMLPNVIGSSMLSAPNLDLQNLRMPPYNRRSKPSRKPSSLLPDALARRSSPRLAHCQYPPRLPHLEMSHLLPRCSRRIPTRTYRPRHLRALRRRRSGVAAAAHLVASHPCILSPFPTLSPAQHSSQLSKRISTQRSMPLVASTALGFRPLGRLVNRHRLTRLPMRIHLQ
jgi:hypothetical protein